METPNERQAKLPESPEAESASVNKAADSSPKQPDHPDDSKTDTPGTAQATSAPHPSNTELADVPRPGQSESSSRKPVTAPSLEETESTPNSSKSSVREQMIAAASMAEHLTEATSSVGTKPNAMERDGSMSLEGTDGDRTASTSPSTSDTLVALLVSRPEIKSMSDLSGKNVAIDNASSESQGNVRTALVAAGAPAVELSTGDSNAIDRLIGGEVPAAIVALVSPDAAEAFPDINGFRIFRVPLSARSAKSGTDVP